jgi:hypothetical protein
MLRAPVLLAEAFDVLDELEVQRLRHEAARAKQKE